MGMLLSKNSSVAVVNKAMAYHNKKDAKGLKSIGAENAKVIVKGESIEWSDYCETVQSVFVSFPDIKFEYDPPTLDEKDGKVLIRKITATGTHTGEPFGFASYEKIAATTPPKKCVNDKETIEFTIDGSKIKEMKITAPEGATSGPPGFYIQIGGKFE